MATNYYAILGVSRDATSEQVRTRFLELARRRHPDRFQGDEKIRAEEEFQALSEAFNVLCDPERRRLYDLDQARGAAPAAQAADKKQVARHYLAQGVEAYRRKSYVTAAESFERAVQEDPSSAQAWHHLARACSHQRQRLARATEAIAKACELEPMKVPYLKAAGSIFLAAGQPAEAERYYRQALTWDPDDAEARRKLEELTDTPDKRRGGLFRRSSG